MVKTKVSQKDTPRQETIQPYFSNDYQIVRKIDESGKASYYHPSSGDEVYTYTYDLYSHLLLIMSGLQTMVDMVDEEAHARFGFAFRSLIRDATNQLEEIFKHIDDTMGCIDLVTVGVNSSIYRNGMIVDARLKPRKEATGGRCSMKEKATNREPNTGNPIRLPGQ